MRRTRQIHIKRALALAGAFNFLCSCAKASLLPFLTLYFRQLGLSPAMVGIVMGAKHLMTLVWSPAASLLAKHYNKRRVAINCSLVLSAMVALVLLVLPPAGAPGALTSSCNTSNTSTTQSVHKFNATSTRPHTLTTSPSNGSADVTPGPETTNSSSSAPREEPSTTNTSVVLNSSREERTTLNSTVGALNSTVGALNSNVGDLKTNVRRSRSAALLEEAEPSRFEFLGGLKEMDSQSQLFFLVLIVVSVWELVAAPLECTADEGLYEYLDFADASDHYSSADVWGLLGATCGAGGAGLLVSQLSCLIAADAPRTAAHFYCYAGLAAAALPVAAYLPLHLNKKRERARGLLKALQLVHGSPHALLCAFTVFLAGVAGSAVENFLLWQMQDHGGSELHMGASLSLAALSHAAFPLLSARVSKLLRPGRVLVAGTASLGLQCFYYSFLWGPWAALPAQVLSAFSGGALWWAVRAQCEDVATPGAERSVRRVFNFLCLLLGSGVGSVAGGFVAQRFGVTWLFRGVAAGLMAWAVCLPLLQWKAPRQRRINYSRLLAADASEASDSESDLERDWLDKAMEEDRGNDYYDGRKSF